MKIILLAIIGGVLSLSAQQQPVAAKIDPALPKAPESVKVPDRPLTQLEVSETLLLAKTAELEGKKIEESQAKIKEAQQKYAEIFTRACLSVGIAADKIQSECGFTTGVGQDDKPLVGQDGHAVAAHVWKLPPQPSPPAAGPVKP